DLLPEEEREARCEALLDELGWDGPVFRISAISGEGTQELCFEIMRWMDERAQAEAENDELRQQEARMRQQIEQEARDAVQAYNARRRGQRLGEAQDDDDDDFDDEVEVYYVQ